MPLPLFAAEENPDSGPSGLVILAGIVVAILVLRWLHTIGFYGKAFKAIVKTVGALIIATVGIVALSSFMGQDKELDAWAAKYTDGILVMYGIVALAGLFVFYGDSPPKPAATVSNPKPKPKPVAVTAAGAGTVAVQTRCSSCHGRGEKIVSCRLCGGPGESRCGNSVQGGWLSMSSQCRGGRMITEYGGDDGVCPYCNGRGFIRCGSCGGRGEERLTCEDCGGSGVV